MPGEDHRHVEDEEDDYDDAMTGHKGTSIHSGHYVAFIKKDTGNSKVWVLFNDEKVVPAESSESFDEIKTSGYVYVYKRKN
ncbi:unnamed protein product [[Candida] boidinii]|nr:unnamed protein product [[Candida] boidinii]